MLKRKAARSQGGRIKKRQFAESCLSDTLALDDRDDESTETGSTLSEDESDQEAVFDTPLTPFSPKDSPRFPSELKTHVCTFAGCGKAFNRPAKLAEHSISHTNTRPFLCPYPPCTKDFLRQSHLKHHIKSAHSNVRDHVCQWEGCGKSFITATRLKRHHAAHEGRAKFTCSIPGCGQTFRKHGTLERHVLSVHEGRQPYSCGLNDGEGNICRHLFDTAGKLRAHQRRVHEGKRFWCTICTKDSSSQANAEEETGGFTTYADLQDHIKVNHPPRCSMCDLVCKSQRDLTSHIQANHGTLDVDDAKAIVCPEPDCGRAFTKKWNLKVHIQSTHNAEKFVCGDVDLASLTRVEGWDGLDACGQPLSTKGALVNHIRRVHMGMGQVRSATKKKPRSDLMRRNLMKLTGMGYEDERYIACVIPSCEVRFKRVYDLRIHLVSHHQLSEEDAEEAVVISEEKSGSNGYGNEESLPHDLMHDIDPRDWHMMDPGSREADLMENGTFWEEEEEEAERFGGLEKDPWLRDEREMRMLIDDEQSEIQGDREPVMAIDPSLQ
ncbi:MAG: hypothetical protein LQ350_001660 [Teloschistes chrysophthalmus]|nr:MAG: hypothetical protein LQ350_001660 [Niorma chrysophthalma]